jgi:hypothetical protein
MVKGRVSAARERRRRNYERGGVSLAHGAVVVVVVRIISSEKTCVGRRIFVGSAQRISRGTHSPQAVAHSLVVEPATLAGASQSLSFLLTLSSWPGVPTMSAGNGYSALSVGGNLAPKSAKFALSVLKCLA